MARIRKVEVVVLCEDVGHKTFVLRCLTALGFNLRQIRVKLPRAGRGAGEQWVREHYPAEAKAQRRVANHTGATLITMIDADTLGVEQRRQQLDSALVEAELAPRGPEERIAIVIPRRNIESWIHFAIQREIDETADFKRRYQAIRACRDAARVALEVFRSGADEALAPPSLATACDELRRVVQA